MLTIYEIKAISVYMILSFWKHFSLNLCIFCIHQNVLLRFFHSPPSFGPIRGIHSLTATPRAPLWCTRGQYVRGRSLWGYSVRRERTRWDEIFVVCRAKCVQFSLFAPPPPPRCLFYFFRLQFCLKSLVQWISMFYGFYKWEFCNRKTSNTTLMHLILLFFSMFGFYKS